MRVLQWDMGIIGIKIVVFEALNEAVLVDDLHFPDLRAKVGSPVKAKTEVNISPFHIHIMAPPWMRGEKVNLAV
ncbi:MAG: hypothetical protein ABW047_17530 [Nitrospiraceae bacterium]